MLIEQQNYDLHKEGIYAYLKKIFVILSQILYI